MAIEEETQAIAAAAAQEASELKTLVRYVQDAVEAETMLVEVQEKIRTLTKRLERITDPLVESRRKALEAKREVEALFNPALSELEAIKADLKPVIAQGAEAQRRAQEAALASARTPEDVAAAISVPTIKSSTYEEVMFEVVDFAKVPDKYKVLCHSTVKQAGEAGRPVPGIRFWKETRVRTPTRR